MEPYVEFLQVLHEEGVTLPGKFYIEARDGAAGFQTYELPAREYWLAQIRQVGSLSMSEFEHVIGISIKAGVTASTERDGCIELSAYLAGSHTGMSAAELQDCVVYRSRRGLYYTGAIVHNGQVDPRSHIIPWAIGRITATESNAPDVLDTEPPESQATGRPLAIELREEGAT